MSYTSLFMKYHDMLQDRITAIQKDISIKRNQLTDNEIATLICEKITMGIEPFKDDIQEHCIRNCRVCNTGNIQDCDFFYALVVFGDEMIIKTFEIRNPVLEKNYFGTAQGGDIILNKMCNLSKKYDWNPYDKEFARVFYYMLILGFQQGAKEDRQGKRNYALYSFRNRLNSEEFVETLTPSIYSSIDETPDNVSMLPSLKATTLWMILLVIAFLFVFNGVWYFITEKIQDNLGYVTKELNIKEKK